MRRNLVELAFVALLSGIVIDAWGDSPYVLTDLGKVGVGNSNLAMNAAGQVIGSRVASGVQCAFLFDGTLHDLTLGGTSGEISHAFALNNLGQVVGGAYTASGQYHAFLYSNGAMIDLNTFAPAGSGYTLSTASAINDAGTILCTGTDAEGPATFLYSNGIVTNLGKVGVGNSNLAMNAAGQVIGSRVASGVRRAFLFDGTLRDLTLGGTSGEISHAFALNNLGQVVGGAYTASGQYHAFLYSNGAMIDLNTFAPAGSGYTLSTASAINDAGRILCTGTDAEGPATFLYSNGIVTNLGKVGVGNSNLAMNAAGQVIGSGVASGVQRAFFFDGTLRDLTLGGTSGEISHAFALNNLGQVVGGAYTASGQYHAFLYSNGTTTDLNTFAPAGSGYTLSTASAINDAGTILCTGTDPNGAAVFLLVTVPEPSTSALVVAGAIGLLACVWQRKPAK